MGGLGQIFQSLWVLLPHWVVGMMVGITVIALVPGWNFRRRSSGVREAVRQMVRAEHDALVRLETRVWAHAGDHVDLLASVVREARRRDLPRLANEALARLEADPANARLVAQLRAEVSRDLKHKDDVLATVLRIEALIGDDRQELAREALAAALERWPDDAHLALLRQRMDRLDADAGAARADASAS